MADTNYTRGEMDIEDHAETFGGFMSMSMYGGAAIIVALIVPILVFAANIAWPAAMLVGVVLGVILGIAMKFKAQWYAVLIGTAILFSVIIGLLTLFV